MKQSRHLFFEYEVPSVNQSWNSYEQAADHGPFRFATKVIVLIFTLATLSTAASCLYRVVIAPIRLANQAADVVAQEFSPRALFDRYTWFKNASAALDKKRADIKVYEVRVSSIERAYEGATRRTWAREDREQLSIWMSEAAGIKASYNQLASEYNAAMAKINWRFTEIGNLPPGATSPLPREYKPYIEE